MSVYQTEVILMSDSSESKKVVFKSELSDRMDIPFPLRLMTHFEQMELLR